MYSKQSIPSPFCISKHEQATKQASPPSAVPVSLQMQTSASSQPKNSIFPFPVLLLSLLLLQEKG